MRPQDFYFITNPRRAITNLVRRRNAISSARRFPGKTSTNRGEINCRSNNRLVHSTEFLEPTEESFASSVRERPLQDRFARAWRLADQHDVADNRATGDRSRLHPWTTPAILKTRNMLLKTSLIA